ncbi:hypothetical protein NMY22_g4194 [Coprinellus aureogranulatus]|nr:hypothetical protein NMY22_g4194 [Coprinellus aureogranulatus]
MGLDSAAKYAAVRRAPMDDGRRSTPNAAAEENRCFEGVESGSRALRQKDTWRSAAVWGFRRWWAGEPKRGKLPRGPVLMPDLRASRLGALLSFVIAAIPTRALRHNKHAAHQPDKATHSFRLDTEATNVYVDLARFNRHAGFVARHSHRPSPQLTEPASPPLRACLNLFPHHCPLFYGSQPSEHAGPHSIDPNAARNPDATLQPRGSMEGGICGLDRILVGDFAPVPLQRAKDGE